jgi:hypothetical protein
MRESTQNIACGLYGSSWMKKRVHLPALGSDNAAIENGKNDGNNFSFFVGWMIFKGEIKGDAIEIKIDREDSRHMHPIAG